MSCQHFPPKRIFKFLVNQCWKLIQRCSLKVSISFLSPLFQHMHRSMSTLKICLVENLCRWHEYVNAYLNFGFKNQFFYIIVSFSVNLCISGLQSGFGEISENCDFGSKMRGFFYQKKSKNNFSAQIVLHSFCNLMLNTESISELSIMRYVFQKKNSVCDLYGSDP